MTNFMFRYSSAQLKTELKNYYTRRIEIDKRDNEEIHMNQSKSSAEFG